MIDVSAEQLQTIKNILKQHVPDCEVRAFGSRYKWTAKGYSDLDLAIVGVEKIPFRKITALRTAFEESDLIFRVDVLDWHAISPEFQQVIEQGYEVIQKPGQIMSSNDWPIVKLGDIVQVKGGKRLPKGTSYSDHETNHPYIRLVDIQNGRITNQSIQYINEKTHSMISRYIVDQGDVCLAIVGNTIGMVFYVDENWAGANLTENAAKLTNFNGADSKYIFFYLTSQNGQSEIFKNAVGSAQGKLPIYGIKNIELALPPLPTQRRVADILSALDDKIELNRQTNATLEAIAQAIFKEWFVNFNFPGATGEMVESELGMIPKGWRVGKLGEICEFAYGKGLKSEIRIEGKYPVVGSNGIVGTHNDYLVKGPGIVIGRKGTIGEVAWIHQNFFPIDTTFYINDLLGVNNLYFHFFLLKVQDFKKIGSDSAVPGLNRNQAYESFVAIPAKDLINQFNDITQAIFEDINNNTNQSATLAAIRDALLPKLMRGKIDV